MLVRKKENDVVIIGSTLHTTHADTTLGKVNTIIKILPNRSDKSGKKSYLFYEAPRWLKTLEFLNINIFVLVSCFT